MSDDFDFEEGRRMLCIGSHSLTNTAALST
jgi:hypothetical protein